MHHPELSSSSNNCCRPSASLCIGHHSRLLLRHCFFLLVLLAISLPSPSLAIRNKEIDENYQRLIPLLQIPQGCEHARGVEPVIGGDPAREYGFVDGVGLEKCRVWLDEESHSASDEDGHYERYKCKHLRVHAHYNDETGKCECKERWKGPTCNEYIGCPVNHSYIMGVCTPNVCQHDGQLALGSKHIECICKAPWDGRFCDRLACWRMAEKEHERRWRNAGDRCRCADNYVGENCETLISCQNGELWRKVPMCRGLERRSLRSEMHSKSNLRFRHFIAQPFDGFNFASFCCNFAESTMDNWTELMMAMTSE